MAQVSIFWDPQGYEVDSLGTKSYLRVTDGDTPYVSVSIRMLSIDAPETHYPRRTRPSRHDANLAQLARWIEQGKAPLDDGLAAHLRPKLATGNAGTLHEQQGEEATAVLREMMEQRLTRPSGRKRRLYVQAADERFDFWGRLLAYIAPAYSASERQALSRKDRATFNLLMVEAGWAATLFIYPSIPKYDDLVLAHKTAQDAVDEKRGAWSDSLTLTGYEFRMCVRLYEVTKKLVGGASLPASKRFGWIERHCADMTTRELHRPQDYFKVEPYNRVFIWPEDVAEAAGRLNLVPG